MGCRVGISKSPEARIERWKSEEGHTYGKVLYTGLTYSQAQTREEEEGEARGCYWKAGGDPGNDRLKHVWSVYYVSGGAVPSK